MVNSYFSGESDDPMVSIGLTVFNGERFLETALDSLTKIDYNNYEIIILDNMSSDRTNEICLQYSKLDNRIRYIIDTDPCTSHEASLRVANYARGEYFMLAGDDDSWDPSYLKKIMAFYDKNDAVDLVYTRFGSIDVNNLVIEDSCGGLVIDYQDSAFFNFLRYLFKRSCVPMVFGVFRIKAYKKILPFKIFDNTLMDADNLYLLKFLANYRVHCIDETLFYYREKDRSERPEGSTDDLLRVKYPSQFSKYFYIYCKHQINFLLQIFSVLDDSKFKQKIKLILKCFAFISMCTTIGILSINALKRKIRCLRC